MPVDAVVTQVGLAAYKPLGVGQVPFEDFVPGLEPVEVGGRPGPELFRVFDGLLVEGLVFFKTLDVSLGGEFRRRREDTVFTECGVDVCILL
jgi:hypothetical protein